MRLERAVALAALLSALAGLPAAAQQLDASVTWVGNSFSGKDAWVLQDVEGLCVTPDGTVFTNVFWDEGGGNVQEYKDGRLVRMAGHTHGWGYEGGAAVAANSRYLFIAQNVNNEGGGLKGDSWPAKGFTWSGVSRRKRDDIRRPAPFAGGHGKEGDVLQGAFLPVATLPEGGTGAVRGLAASEKELFVSSPFDGRIYVYDAETMAPVRSWQVARPDRIALDHEGALWVLQRPEASGPWRVLRFRADGKALPEHIDLGAGVVPGDLCADRQGRILVADTGPSQQVLAYGAAGRLQSSFGVKGGIFAGPTPGAFGDRRLNNPRGIGVDASGNLYVASSGSVAGGSTVLECYRPDGKLAWRRMGLTFVDMVDSDPANAADVYSKEERFALDFAKPAGEEWSYRAYTVNRFKYPDDPRLHTGPTNAAVRTLAGKRFLFVWDMTAEYLSVYRFSPATDGETAIPCALFGKRGANGQSRYPAGQPDKGEWMWLDANANGAIDAGEIRGNGGAESQGLFVPDEQGALWQANGATIRALPFQGLSAKGVPRWDYAKARSYPRPAGFDEVRRLRYLPNQDVMLLGGNSGDDRNQHWKPMGPVLALYEGWSSGAPRLRKRIVLPYEKGSNGHESIEPISFDVAGDYVFVAYTRGLRSEGIQNAFVKVLRLSDLSVVGNLTVDRSLGEIGLQDLVESVSARRRPNGEYLVFLEDDAKAKVVLFRWTPG